MIHMYKGSALCGMGIILVPVPWKRVGKQHMPTGGILSPLPQLLHHLSRSRLELALAAVGILVLGSYH